MKNEHEWLRRLGAVIGHEGGGVEVGIGDDAAVLSPPRGPLVVTVDACVEGVHFTRAIASPGDVGYRSFMAAASDLAAMGARPVAALSALTLPPALSEAELDALVEGQRLASLACALPIVGGNLSRGPVLTVTTTALGEALRPALRSGARPGQGLWLAGPVGLAAAGLRALLGGVEPRGPLAACVEAWRRPQARIEQGLAAAGRAASMIDISDGLAQDAAHVARASGARLVFEAERVLDHAGPALGEAAALLGAEAAALAFAGGEDYALLASSEVDLSDAGFVRVGRVEAGEPGVVVLARGEPWRPPPGFDHGG